MLEVLDKRWAHHVVHRFANPLRILEFAEERGLTIEEVHETVEFFGQFFADELLKSPFKLKTLLNLRNTRFSDGSWTVFYSALERKTAEAEVKYWYANDDIGGQQNKRPVYYSAFHCTLNGDIVDLRPMKAAWPELVDDDYTFCQNLAKEAKSADVDAFLSPSARHPRGTTVPVFLQRALTDPVIYETVRFAYDTATASVTCEVLQS